MQRFFKELSDWIVGGAKLKNKNGTAQSKPASEIDSLVLQCFSARSGYLVIQFFPWFNCYFPLSLCIAMCDNENRTKKNNNWTKDKTVPQHIFYDFFNSICLSCSHLQMLWFVGECHPQINTTPKSRTLIIRLVYSRNWKWRNIQMMVFVIDGVQIFVHSKNLLNHRQPKSMNHKSDQFKIL